MSKKINTSKDAVSMNAEVRVRPPGIGASEVSVSLPIKMIEDITSLIVKPFSWAAINLAQPMLSKYKAKQRSAINTILETAKIQEYEGLVSRVTASLMEKGFSCDISSRAANISLAEQVLEDNSQINTLKVIALAYKMADSSVRAEIEDCSVSPEFARKFYRGAKTADNDTLREMWAKILLGEAMIPGSFSPRTLSFMESLICDEAERIKKFMRYVWTFHFPDSDNVVYGYFCRVKSRKGITSEGDEIDGTPRHPFVYYDDRFIMQYFGVLSMNQAVSYKAARSASQISYYGKTFRYPEREVAKSHRATVDGKSVFKTITIDRLTPLGIEMYRLCRMKPHYTYMKSCIAHYQFIPAEKNECK